MDMARVWPIVCEFGIGAVLLTVGVWAGISSGYLNLKDKEDKNLLLVLAGGFVALLIVVSLFTFWLPMLPGEAVQ